MILSPLNVTRYDLLVLSLALVSLSACMDCGQGREQSKDGASIHDAGLGDAVFADIKPIDDDSGGADANRDGGLEPVDAQLAEAGSEAGLRDGTSADLWVNLDGSLRDLSVTEAGSTGDLGDLTDASSQACIVGGGETYTALQQALNDEHCLEIHLLAGTHPGGNLVERTVHIIGEGIDSTIVDAQGNGRAFEISASGSQGEVILEGMSVTGGDAYGSGAGIGAFSAPSLILRNLHIYGNRLRGIYSGVLARDMAQGAGLYVERYTQTLIEDCLIEDNEIVAATTSYAEGGGLFLEGPSIIRRSELRENLAAAFDHHEAHAQGGGIWAGQTLRLEDVILSGNRAEATLGNEGARSSDEGAKAFGGGLVARYGRIELVGSSLINNQVLSDCSSRSVESSCGASSGALSVIYGGLHERPTLLIEQSEILGNKIRLRFNDGDKLYAMGAGGVSPGTTTIMKSRIIGNSIDLESSATVLASCSLKGGGFSASYPAFSDVLIAENTINGLEPCKARGAGLYVYGGTFDRVAIVDNIISQSAYALGAAACFSFLSYNSQSEVLSHMQNVTVSGNRFFSAGASSTLPHVPGIAIFGSRRKEMEIVNSTFADNTDDSGADVTPLSISADLGVLRIYHSVLNTMPPSGDDCPLVNGTASFVSTGHNRFEQAGSCLLANSDLEEMSVLEPLLSISGSSVHLPPAESPLFGGGAVSGCHDHSGNAIPFDQLGQERRGACTIGAVAIRP